MGVLVMKLLDLFCGAGGCAEGYRQAGFTEILGVDNKPQPNYPFEFVQMDAISFVRMNGGDFDATHASPPCQVHSVTASLARDDHKDLIPQTREVLQFVGTPWVIENVPGSPLLSPMILCGTMFGLEVYRHRLFEFGFPVPTWAPKHPKHKALCQDWRKAGKRDGGFVTVAGHNFHIAEARKAMGIEWMNQKEIAQAIPPAYTKFIGGILLDEIFYQKKKASHKS